MKKDKGRRCKYYYVAKEAGVIIKEVMAFVKFKSEGRLEEGQMEGFLSILENENLINTLQESFA